MDLHEIGGAMMRRWYLSVVAVVAATVIAFLVSAHVGPAYVAKSTLVPMPPKSVIVAAKQDKAYAPNNPLLYLATLTNARDVLVSSLGGSQIQTQVARQAPGATVSAAADIVSGSPMINVSSQGATPDIALGGLRAMDRVAGSTLSSVQDQLKVQPENRVSLLTLVEDNHPTTKRKKQIEYTVIAFAVCLLLFLLIIAAVDGQGRNRRRNRKGRRERATASTPDGAEPPPTPKVDSKERVAGKSQ